MSRRAYLLITAVIFFLVALLHLVRIMFDGRRNSPSTFPEHRFGPLR
jgi:hypothetical protein